VHLKQIGDISDDRHIFIHREQVFKRFQISFIVRRSINKVIVLKAYLKITWGLRIPD